MKRPNLLRSFHHLNIKTILSNEIIIATPQSCNLRHAEQHRGRKSFRRLAFLQFCHLLHMEQFLAGNMGSIYSYHRLTLNCVEP